MSLALGVKLFAAPLLIALASLAGRRWGPGAAGLLGGLPLVGGPAVLVLWLTESHELTLAVIQAAPVGVWATLVYLLAFGYFSARLSWLPTLAASWACYLGAEWSLHALDLAASPLLGAAAIPALWLAATRLLPQPARMPPPTHLPRVELIARMAAAVVLVLTLTSAATRIGADYTGLLAAAPVAATIIPAFTLAKAGRDALLLALRGFLTGLTGFAAFFLALGPGIGPLGALAPAVALLAALGVAALARWLVDAGAGALSEPA
jgi:hypothetical protein